MNTISSDYLEICSQLPPKELTKQERKRRHTLLTSWEKKRMMNHTPHSGNLKISGNNMEIIVLIPCSYEKSLFQLFKKTLKQMESTGSVFFFNVFKDMKTLTVIRTTCFISSVKPLISNMPPYNWLINCFNMNRTMSLP